jgi:PadR family transcriptional regulator PadR
MKRLKEVPPISQKEAIVLGILFSCAAREMYGLEIIDESSGLLKRGTIYVTLQRMEEKSLVTSRREARPKPEIGVPRRLYRPTGIGEMAFQSYRRTHERVREVLAGAELRHA